MPKQLIRPICAVLSAALLTLAVSLYKTTVRSRFDARMQIRLQQIVDAMPVLAPEKTELKELFARAHAKSFADCYFIPMGREPLFNEPVYLAAVFSDVEAALRTRGKNSLLQQLLTVQVLLAAALRNNGDGADNAFAQKIKQQTPKHPPLAPAAPARYPPAQDIRRDAPTGKQTVEIASPEVPNTPLSVLARLMPADEAKIRRGDKVDLYKSVPAGTISFWKTSTCLRVARSFVPLELDWSFWEATHSAGVTLPRVPQDKFERARMEELLRAAPGEKFCLTIAVSPEEAEEYRLEPADKEICECNMRSRTADWKPGRRHIYPPEKRVRVRIGG